MEEGVLCLKWRDHRSTFLRMLSSTRKKGAFCDATLVCEGKFYPVHQLVLSTCSDYFQQMFEAVSGRPHTTTPLLVVLAGVTQRDLEALLEYMYAGEATILQGELATFMKAAEGLKIRGLAEPSPAEEPESPRRPQDTWAGKRKREEGGRRIMLTDIVSPAQLATVELAPEAQSERDMATGTPGDLPGAVAPLSPPLILPQVKYEDILVKDEPQHRQEEDWRHQGKRRKAATLGEGTDAEQILGFCDPGLTYLAHSSGLGALGDPGHASHHPGAIHQRRMGRPTSEIWHHYIIERAAGKTAVYCRYCSQKYGYPNATKMKIHTMKCSKCPEEVKRQFEGTRPDVVEGADGTLRLGLDLGGDTQYQPHHVERAEHIENTLPKAVTDNPSVSIKTLSFGDKNTPPDAAAKTDSPAKPKRQFPSPEKSKGSSSSPEKAHSSEVSPPKDHQPPRSSKPDDRVSLRSERVYHHPAF